MHGVKKCFPSFSIFQVLPLLCFVFLEIPMVKNNDYDKNAMAPVILVPGIGGSKIEYKWHTHGQPGGCEKKSSEWIPAWVDYSRVIGGDRNVKCWAFRFQLLYDRTTHRCRNQDGVVTRVPRKFGSCKPVEYLSDDLFVRAKLSYYHKVIYELKKRGYSTDHSLKAAAYDWRFAPPQQEEFGYFDQMTQLVEHVAADCKRKVALVAHSNGGLMMAYFLRNQTQAWKDKHIHAFVAISTPWAGSVNSIHTYLTGTNYGLSLIKKSTMKQLTRTFQTVAFLLPSEEEYKTTVLVDWTSKQKKYTANDYQQFFTDIGYEDGYLMRQDLRSLFPVAIDQLGVRTYCVWANMTEIKTLERFEVNGDINDEKSISPFYGEGDGTVPLKSLRYCEKYKSVTVKSFQGTDHTQVIHRRELTDYIMSVITQAQAFS